MAVGLRLASLVILARLLSPETFGLVAIAHALASFVGAIALLGLGMAAVRAQHVSENTYSALFYCQSLVGCALGTALYLTSGAVASMYQEPALSDILKWLALVPVLQGMQAQHRIHLVRDMRFTALAIVEVISLSTSISAAILLASLGYGYLAVTTQIVTLPATQFLMVIIMSKWVPQLRFRWTLEIRQIFGVGVNILSMNILRNFARSLLTPILGFYVPVSQVGQFDRAQQLSIVPISLTVDQLQRVALPVLSQVREDPIRLGAYLRRAQLLSLYGSGTGFWVLAALCPSLVEVVLGDNWTAAGWVLSFLALGGAFRVLGESASWTFMATDTRAGLRFMAIAQPAIPGISLLGLPWGIYGVSIASSAAWLIYWPLASIAAARMGGYEVGLMLREAIRVLLTFSAPVATAVWLTQALMGAGGGTELLAGIFVGIVAAGILVACLPALRRDAKLLRDTARMAMFP